jgi:hypothetical protein
VVGVHHPPEGRRTSGHFGSRQLTLADLQRGDGEPQVAQVPWWMTPVSDSRLGTATLEMDEILRFEELRISGD